jgi:hypothetical protein
MDVPPVQEFARMAEREPFIARRRRRESARGQLNPAPHCRHVRCRYQDVPSGPENALDLGERGRDIHNVLKNVRANDEIEMGSVESESVDNVSHNDRGVKSSERSSGGLAATSRKFHSVELTKRSPKVVENLSVSTPNIQNAFTLAGPVDAGLCPRTRPSMPGDISIAELLTSICFGV